MTHSLLPDALLVAGVATLFGLLLLAAESGAWLVRKSCHKRLDATRRKASGHPTSKHVPRRRKEVQHAS